MQGPHIRGQRDAPTSHGVAQTEKEKDSRIRAVMAGQESTAFPGSGSIRSRSTRPEAVCTTEAARGISEESPLMGCGQGRRRGRARRRTASRMAIRGPAESTAARCKAGIRRAAYYSISREWHERRLVRLRATTAYRRTETTDSCQSDRRAPHLED